jgi:hypothetical protein
MKNKIIIVIQIHQNLKLNLINSFHSSVKAVNKSDPIILNFKCFLYLTLGKVLVHL